MVKFCVLAAFTISIASSQNLWAKPTETSRNFVYQVYAGGIHALEASLALNLSSTKNYDVTLDAYTRGFLGTLVPWRGSFESSGWHIQKGEFRPKLHRSVGEWRKETEIKEYKYNKDQSFAGLFITEHDKPVRQEKVVSALTDNTVDILSAALSVFERAAIDNTCEGRADVFDGKRWFEVIFEHQGTEILKASKHNPYNGEAMKCTVEIKPIDGAWHKKPRGWLSIQEQGRAKGTMPTLWVAKLSDNGPAMPVKIRVKTDYGTLFMHLTRYGAHDSAQ